MKSGDIVLTLLPQADGHAKLRPTLVLCLLPPFDDILVCGISSQLHQRVPDFDDLIDLNDPDFARTGLAAPSVIRLGFLATVPQSIIKGRIGILAPPRVALLRARLAQRVADARDR